MRPGHAEGRASDLLCLFAARERGLGFDRQLARTKYSLPFAMASGFFAMRGQADHWVVAMNFSSSAFALISIASVVNLLGSLTRQPVGNGLLPDISSLLGEGDLNGARKLMSKGYLLLGAAWCPRRSICSKGANPRSIVTSLVREAVAAQELYETIRHEYIHKP